MKDVLRERVVEEGVALLEEFSRELEDVPETEETHYVLDLCNVLRDDGESVRKDFRLRFQRIVPRWDEGYVVAEKGL